MSPAVNPDPKTIAQMIKYMQTGVIDTLASDNCCICMQQHRAGIDDFTKIPIGVNGGEDRLSVAWTNGVRTGLLT